jgi:hypothetical protein
MSVGQRKIFYVPAHVWFHRSTTPLEIGSHLRMNVLEYGIIEPG